MGWYKQLNISSKFCENMATNKRFYRILSQVPPNYYDQGIENNEKVTIIRTLEHLKNPSLILRETNGVLKKNGYLIIGQDTDSLLFKLVWFLWTLGKGSV